MKFWYLKCKNSKGLVVADFDYSDEGSWAAEQYADVNKGQCKIFNDATSQVVGSAGF